MEKKCGCWAVLRRNVRGSCKSSASKNSANSIPRSSLVYDAGLINFHFFWFNFKLIVIDLFPFFYGLLFDSFFLKVDFDHMNFLVFTIWV